MNGGVKNVTRMRFVMANLDQLAKCVGLEFPMLINQAVYSSNIVDFLDTAVRDLKPLQTWRTAQPTLFDNSAPYVLFTLRFPDISMIISFSRYFDIYLSRFPDISMIISLFQHFDIFSSRFPDISMIISLFQYFDIFFSFSRYFDDYLALPTFRYFFSRFPDISIFCFSRFSDIYNFYSFPLLDLCQ
jgi:hypothetical protein